MLAVYEEVLAERPATGDQGAVGEQRSASSDQQAGSGKG
jgi:hypothetical protein